MKKLLLALLLISPIASANMDDLCFVYIKEFGTNDILNAIQEQDCVRNNVLQVVYGMDNASETIMMFHSCLLYTSPSPRDSGQSRMPSSA